MSGPVVPGLFRVRLAAPHVPAVKVRVRNVLVPVTDGKPPKPSGEKNAEAFEKPPAAFTAAIAPADVGMPAFEAPAPVVNDEPTVTAVRVIPVHETLAPTPLIGLAPESSSMFTENDAPAEVFVVAGVMWMS